MVNHHSILPWVAAVLLWAPVLGCHPWVEDEPPAPGEGADYRRLPADAAAREEAVRLVKESVSETEGQTTEEWIQYHVESLPGDVLFPRWEGSRLGPEKYEVRYTFTHIGEENRLSRRGYAWTVNVVLGLVGPLRELRSEELEARQPGRTLQDRYGARSREDFSLE